MTSSFCLGFLEINGRLSKYKISPDALFISGEARPFVNWTPKLRTFVPVGLVVIPLNPTSTAPENPPVVVTTVAEDSKFKTFPAVDTPT